MRVSPRSTTRRASATTCASCPKDTIQGAALATLMKEDGCTAAYILNDKEVYGAGLSRNIESSAKEQGLEVLGNEGIDPKAPNFRSQAATMKSEGADCFVFSGITANGAVQLYKDVAAALPDAKLYGPDGVAESGFADPAEGGIPDERGCPHQGDGGDALARRVPARRPEVLR